MIESERNELPALTRFGSPDFWGDFPSYCPDLFTAYFEYAVWPTLN